MAVGNPLQKGGVNGNIWWDSWPCVAMFDYWRVYFSDGVVGGCRNCSLCSSPMWDLVELHICLYHTYVCIEKFHAQFRGINACIYDYICVDFFSSAFPAFEAEIVAEGQKGLYTEKDLAAGSFLVSGTRWPNNPFWFLMLGACETGSVCKETSDGHDWLVVSSMIKGSLVV